MCVDCKMKCYCLECDAINHDNPKKAMHKRKRITIGKPYKVHVLGDGDGFTFPKTHDWVTLNYKLYVKQKEVREKTHLGDDDEESKCSLTHIVRRLWT